MKDTMTPKRHEKIITIGLLDSKLQCTVVENIQNDVSPGSRTLKTQATQF